MKNKILVVDDDHEILKLLQSRLESEGFQVTTATTGKDAVELAKNERPSLLLLDVILPDTDGFDVCQKIKADPASKDTPVIMLTGLNLPEDGKRAIIAGANAYITKPIDSICLIEKIRSLLRR